MNPIIRLIICFFVTGLVGILAAVPAYAQETCYRRTIDPVTITYNGVATATATSMIRISRFNTTDPNCVLPSNFYVRINLWENGFDQNGVQFNEFSTRLGGVDIGAYTGAGRAAHEQMLTPRFGPHEGGAFQIVALNWSGDVAAPIPVTFEIRSGQAGARAITARIRLETFMGPGEWFGSGPSTTLTLTVPPALELSVSGVTTGAGSPTGTLEFGTFSGTSGTSRALSIRALATTAFHVEVESTQGGVLRRTTTCATAAAASTDTAEQLPYTVDIGGQAITPASWGGTIGSANRYANASNTNAAANQRIILPVTVTVPAFDLTSRRAGQFCDVVRLRIRAQ
jgi:hypothetical protein